MAREPILERAVMELLWDSDDPLTPRQVKTQLPEASTLAYTTVMTVMARLWKKGRLDRQRQGKAYAYSPAVGRDQFAAAQMERFLDKVRDRPAVLNRFVDALTPEDRAELRKMLDR